MKRKQPLKRRGSPRPVNTARKAREFARSFHSRARVEFVQSLPCIVCGRTPSDSAHIEVLGMGIKADASKTVPLCTLWLDGNIGRGHHWELDNGDGRRAGFEQRYHVDLTAAAARTDAAWRDQHAATRSLSF